MSKLWWMKKWNNKICGITHTRLRPGTDNSGISYATTLPCGHGFYTKPLLQWVHVCNKNLTQATCPTCRSIIKYF